MALGRLWTGPAGYFLNHKAMTKPAMPTTTATTNRARVQNNCLRRRVASCAAFRASCQPSQSSAKPFVMLRSVPMAIAPGGLPGSRPRPFSRFQCLRALKLRTSGARFRRRSGTTHFSRKGILAWRGRASASPYSSNQPVGRDGIITGRLSSYRQLGECCHRSLVSHSYERRTHSSSRVSST
jgi:hypothetical protein